MPIQLSTEQTKFIQAAKNGYNVLVDACIGSGKTTAIQALCNALPPTKRILYLTYNKLLKLDAKSRIYNSNTQVTNYHGFGYLELLNNGVHAGVSDIIQTYNRVKPPCNRFDVLILDEYQDIEQETSEMLQHIKSQNPNLQIIAVGDMAQKIYDKTVLDAAVFIDRFLGSYVRMEFTICFRLSEEWAAKLGTVWGKKIIGVNDTCDIEVMSYNDAFDFIAMQEPRDLLCLGANHAQRNHMLNDLEEAYPNKFNKNTVWSKVSESDGGATQPTPSCAIFTTFDGCKGMERDIAVVFDWTQNYWHARTDKPGAKYEILRNIFCVAASRGKRKIILVRPNKGTLLNTTDLMEYFDTRTDFKDMDVNGMFDFKYVEDVEAAYAKLKITEVQPAEAPIDLPITDGMIDLSMCIGLCMKAEYFDGFDIDRAIDAFFEMHKDVEFKRIPDLTGWSIEQKILYLTALETNQNRYWTQVSVRFMTPEKRAEIQERLSRVLPNDAKAQVKFLLDFTAFKAIGYADAIHNDTAYSLRFTQELQHINFLQAAMYGIANNTPNIRLWNLHTNQMFSIEIPDKRVFMNKVARAITKGALTKYHGLDDAELVKDFCNSHANDCVDFAKFVADYTAKKKTPPPSPKIQKFFKDRNLTLPVNVRQFNKHFGPIMKKMSDSGLLDQAC